MARISFRGPAGHATCHGEPGDKLWDAAPVPSQLVGPVGPVAQTATVASDFSAYRRWSPTKAAGNLAQRPARCQPARDFLAFIEHQCQLSPAARRRHDAAMDRQNPINPALVPPSQRSRNRSDTLPAFPAFLKLGLLLCSKPDPRSIVTGPTANKAGVGLHGAAFCRRRYGY